MHSQHLGREALSKVFRLVPTQSNLICGRTSNTTEAISTWWTLYCHITCFTGVSLYHCDLIKHGTNTQIDFINFVFYCLENQHLKKNDILVLDNARIHRGGVVEKILLPILQRAEEVHVVFLPKYSPELNPCELVWASVKNGLRNRRIFTSLFQSFVLGFGLISDKTMKSFFSHCITSVLSK